MGVFEQIELQWKGKTYVIPPKRVLEAIAAMEDHITLAQLSAFGEQPQLAKLSQAFAAALRVAKAKVDPDEVYEALFSDARTSIAESALKLMLMMLPPSARARIDAASSDDDDGNAGAAGNAQPPAALH
jgi:hypothetical protein